MSSTDSSSTTPRFDGRAPHDLRPTTIQTDYIKAPLSSALIKSGSTWVLCTASLDESQPPFLRAQKSPNGWVTAEYSMLPGSTPSRASRGSNGRSKEIERLIGRSLRASIDLTKLGPRTLTIDCDVLQADGGTRTASITGGYVALALAVARLQARGAISENPLRCAVAAISVGRIDGRPCLDLPYEEDSRAEVDMNIVMAQSLSDGAADPQFVEVQGTGEQGTFSKTELDRLVSLAERGIGQLFTLQREALRSATVSG